MRYQTNCYDSTNLLDRFRKSLLSFNTELLSELKRLPDYRIRLFQQVQTKVIIFGYKSSFSPQNPASALLSLNPGEILKIKAITPQKLYRENFPSQSRPPAES